MVHSPAYSELAQNMAELERIFNFSTDMIGSGDIDGYFTKINASFKQTLGYTEEEFLHVPFISFVHPEDVDETKAALIDAASGKKNIFIVNRYRCKDGSYKWIEWKVLAILQERKFFAVGRDVTERQLAEKERIKHYRELQALFRISELALKDAPLDSTLDRIVAEVAAATEFPVVAIELYDADRQIMSFAAATGIPLPGGERRLEVPVSETLSGIVAQSGEPMIEKRAQERPEYISEKLRRLHVQTFVCVPMRIRDRVIGALSLAHPEIVTVEEQLKPLASSLANTIATIIERKWSEDSLRASHERFLTVMNSIDAIIYVADIETHEILFVNKYTIDTIGRDITGEPCWKAYRGEPGPCRFCNNDRLIDEHGKPTGVLVWQAKNPVTNKWYINYDRAIEWTDGRLVKLQIATDITDYQRMEAELRHVRKMEAVGTLAGGIAHEFNNILGIILGNTELAIDDIPEWNPNHNYLSEVKNACLRGKDVVKQLLSFSRKSESKKQPLDIRATVKESIRFLRASIPADIEIKENVSDNCHAVIADRTQIHQVIINLCNNAAHAMEDNGGTLDIRLNNVSVTDNHTSFGQIPEPGEYVRLVVSDTGSGIPDSIIDRIFDPFYTTKEIDKGSGLGLSVVRGIVEEHGGFITIESKPRAGTRVSCFFPSTNALPAETSAEEKRIPTGTETILFVDDDESLVTMNRHLLTRLGYAVETQSDPAAALERLKAEPDKFDLLITDMTMPSMTGDQLIKEVLSIRPDIKTIITTGYSKRLDEEKALDIGADGYLMKPSGIKVLAETIRSVLDGRKR